MDKSKEKQPPANDIDLLIEPILVALALGAKIPAPRGCHAWRVDYLDHDRDNVGLFSLGYYASKEEANIALANWIIDEWEQVGRKPWEDEPALENSKVILSSDDPLAEYLNTYTINHIVDYYFKNTSDRYWIEEIIISPFPDSYVSGNKD